MLDCLVVIHVLVYAMQLTETIHRLNVGRVAVKPSAVLTSVASNVLTVKMVVSHAKLKLRNYFCVVILLM